MSIQKNFSIKTLYGGIILNFIINTYHMPNNLFQYFYSYLIYINENIYSAEKVELLLSLSYIIYLLFIPLGILLNINLNFNTNTIIGISLLIRIFSIYLLINCSTNKIFILYLITKSSSSGICQLPILLEIWKYYPNNKGLITGIIYLGKGIFDLIYEQISIKIINPDNIGFISIKGIYPSEINEHYFSYLKILMILFCILSSMCLCLIYPYSIYANYFIYKKNKFKAKISKGLLKDFYILSSKSSYRNTIGSTKSSNNESGLSSNENDKENYDNNINIEEEEPFLSLISSFPFLQLSFIFFLIMAFNSIDLSSINKLGLNFEHKKNFLSFTKLIWLFINIIWNIISGYLLDTYHFKKLLILLTMIQIFLIPVFYLILNKNWGFILFNIFSSIINSSNNVVVSFSFSFLFGDENGLILYGISSIIINTFYIYIDYVYFILEEKIYFFALCFIFTIFYMIALITLCIFVEKKHQYKIENENQEQIMFNDLSNGKELDYIDICNEKEFKNINK